MQTISFQSYDFQVLKDLGHGGQGHALKVRSREQSNFPLVLKTMDYSLEAEQRVKHLVDLRLDRVSPFLAAPLAYEIKDKKVIHLSPFIDGVSLDEDVPRTFPRLVEMATQLAALLTLLEERGIAHGDLSPTNLVISPEGFISLIDWDNYHSDKLPSNLSPRLIGQDVMAAPELQSGKLPASIHSDRFTATILFNQLLLGRHPADYIKEMDKLKEAMIAGGWPERHRIETQDDTPIESLGSDLPFMFDQAFSLEPQTRPSADAWRRELQKSVKKVNLHSCGQAVIDTPSINHCCWCQEKISQTRKMLQIKVLSTGKVFEVPWLAGQSVVLGRSSLELSNLAVSREHLRLEFKPNSIKLITLGSNGTYVNGQRIDHSVNLEFGHNSGFLELGPEGIILKLHI